MRGGGGREREEYAKGESFRSFVFIQLKVNKLSSLKEINLRFILFHNESYFRIRLLYSLDNANAMHHSPILKRH